MRTGPYETMILPDTPKSGSAVTISVARGETLEVADPTRRLVRRNIPTGGKLKPHGMNSAALSPPQLSFAKGELNYSKENFNDCLSVGSC